MLGISLVAILNLGMWVIYALRWGFFERYRIATRAWPWDENPEAWREMRAKAFRALFVNIGIITPLLLVAEVSALGVGVRMDVESFPSRMEMVAQLIFCMFMEDFSFYWSHRTLHTPWFYGRIHKVHHEYTQPIGIAAEYAHPIEFVLGNTIPFVLGPTLLGSRMHFFTKLCWMALRLGETLDGHSGYEFSWSPYRLIPFSGSAQYHNYHHTHNIGNFGSFFTLWDSFFGTNRSYFKYYARVDRKIQQKRANPSKFAAQLHEKLTAAKLGAVKNKED